MLIMMRWLLTPFYFDKDEGSGGGPSQELGNQTPAVDPQAQPKPANEDWRDAKIRELNHENAARRGELKTLNDQFTTLQKSVTERETRAQNATLRAAVIAAAADAKFNDPKDAWNMLDHSALKLNESDEVEGLSDALKKLVEAKPYLLKAQQTTQQQAGPAPKPPSPGNTGGSPKLTADDLKKMSPEEIAKRWHDPVFQKEMAEALKG